METNNRLVDWSDKKRSVGGDNGKSTVVDGKWLVSTVPPANDTANVLSNALGLDQTGYDKFETRTFPMCNGQPDFFHGLKAKHFTTLEDAIRDHEAEVKRLLEIL